MEITIWTSRLDGKDPEGNEIPVLANELDTEKKKQLLFEIQCMVAAQIRKSLSTIALLDPAFRMLTNEGVFVSLEGADEPNCDANRVPSPPLNVKMICGDCRQPIDGAPAVRTICMSCADAKQKQKNHIVQ